MNVLVLNPGSSSIKFSIFATTDQNSKPSLSFDGELDETKTTGATLSILQEERKVNGADSPGGAIAIVLDAVHSAGAAVDAVGYRVVHPGPEIRDHVRITGEVLTKLEAAAEFAPLHDPEAVAIIRETIRRMPDVPHFACFDTVFHQTMPEEASIYPIPTQYRDRGVKRYGFHGLSCESVVRQIRKLGPLPRRMAIAHLGSGCSVTALVNGESIDTTMGLTPTGGVVMGTRPGDLDPGLLLYLLRQQEGTDAPASLEKMLNHQSGMVALSGLPNDMRAVRKAAKDGNSQATLALRVFTREIRKVIGGFSWLMGGLDAIAFTGGIGEHDAETRSDVLSELAAVEIESSMNTATSAKPRRITASHSETAVFVVPAQEDLVIALHVIHMVQVNA